jgi:hypothetical protein
MSHYTCIVVGEDNAKEMEPFQEAPECMKKYAKYAVYVDGKTVYFNSVKEFLKSGIKPLDECGYSVGHWQNPNGKWDWWKVGMFNSITENTKDGYFPLLKGREGNTLHLIGVDEYKRRHGTLDDYDSENNRYEFRVTKDYADVAYKKDIDWEKVKEYKEDYTADCVVYKGKWYGAERGRDRKEDWPEEFWGIIDKIDGEELLTIVDCHT